jgi:hypothetical protein
MFEKALNHESYFFEILHKGSEDQIQCFELFSGSKRGSMAKLSNASFVHTTKQGSNLSIDRQYFHTLFELHLNLNL